jgi:hypothetical protein
LKSKEGKEEERLKESNIEIVLVYCRKDRKEERKRTNEGNIVGSRQSSVGNL